MTGKKIFCTFAFVIMLLNGCGINQDVELSKNSYPLEESVSENNSVQPGEYFPENSPVQLQDGKNSILVYENEDLGIEIQHLVNFPGNYVITCEEQCQEFEIGYVPEDIQEVTITPWDNNSMFLVCNLCITNGNHQYFILNKDMLSEVMIHDPEETARKSLDWKVAERNGTLWLCINQVSAKISANSEKTLEMLGQNIRPLDDLEFHLENDTFVCDVPLAIYGGDKIGAMRLYYEYDGVGMNCINVEFVPLS